MFALATLFEILIQQPTFQLLLINFPHTSLFMKPIVLSIDRTCSLSTIPIPVPTEGEVLINPVCVPVHTLRPY